MASNQESNIFIGWELRGRGWGCRAHSPLEEARVQGPWAGGEHFQPGEHYLSRGGMTDKQLLFPRLHSPLETSGR